MWLLLAACTADVPPETTPTGSIDSAHTAHTAHTADTSSQVSPPVRPIELVHAQGGYTGRAGAALEWAPLSPPLLAVGAPSNSNPDDSTHPAVYLVHPLVQPEAGTLDGEAQFVAHSEDDSWLFGGALEASRFGGQLVFPGDLTGNGSIDVVGFDVGPHPGHPAYLFEGPLTAEPTYRRTDIEGVPIDGTTPFRGAPCGDVSGDGQDDLCTSIGVVYGPVTGAISSYDVTWSAVGPAEDVRILAADLVGSGRPELILSDPATNRIHRLGGGLPAGDQVLDTLALATWSSPEIPTTLASGGDLDGDGLHDLVVAWGGASPAVAVSTNAGGGELSGAHASLAVDARSLTIGDLDGDGQDDLVVGLDGEVRVYLGPVPAGALDPDAADNVLVGHDSPHDEFGFAVLAHDMDGDGDAELAVGAPEDGHSPVGNGRVYVFHDPATFSWDDFDPPLGPIEDAD